MGPLCAERLGAARRVPLRECTASTFPRSDGRRRHRATGPQSGGRLLSSVGRGLDRAGALAGRLRDVSRWTIRAGEPTRRPALDAVADLDFPGGSGVFPGGRLRRRGVVDASMRYRRFLARGLASASTGPGTRTDRGLHRTRVGNRGGANRLWRAWLGARIRGLGGGDASLVPRRLPGGGYADADCDCRTTPLGPLCAGRAGGGGSGNRRRHDRGPRAPPRLAKLLSVLGGAVPARNHLVLRAIGRA